MIFDMDEILRKNAKKYADADPRADPCTDPIRVETRGDQGGVAPLVPETFWSIFMYFRRHFGLFEKKND